MLFCLLTVQCSKEEIVREEVNVCKDADGVFIDCPTPLESLANKDWLTRFKLLKCETPRTRSKWSRSLDGFTLYDTQGLKTMAESGGVSQLNKEYCDAGGRFERIPSGLGDDPYTQGYASVLELNGWLIAMYHPDYEYGADHWIMYRPTDGYWERWDLGTRRERLDSETGDTGRESGIHIVFTSKTVN